MEKEKNPAVPASPRNAVLEPSSNPNAERGSLTSPTIATVSRTNLLERNLSFTALGPDGREKVDNEILLGRIHNHSWIPQFDEAFPSVLENNPHHNVTKEDWTKTIITINKIIMEGESLSFGDFCVGFFGTLTFWAGSYLFPPCYNSYARHYRKLEKFLAEENKRVYEAKNITWLNPVYNGLLYVKILLEGAHYKEKAVAAQTVVIKNNSNKQLKELHPNNNNNNNNNGDGNPNNVSANPISNSNRSNHVMPQSKSSNASNNNLNNNLNNNNSNNNGGAHHSGSGIFLQRERTDSQAAKYNSVESLRRSDQRDLEYRDPPVFQSNSKSKELNSPLRDANRDSNRSSNPDLHHHQHTTTKRTTNPTNLSERKSADQATSPRKSLENNATNKNAVRNISAQDPQPAPIILESAKSEPRRGNSGKKRTTRHHDDDSKANKGLLESSSPAGYSPRKGNVVPQSSLELLISPQSQLVPQLPALSSANSSTNHLLQESDSEDSDHEPLADSLRRVK